MIVRIIVCFQKPLLLYKEMKCNIRIGNIALANSQSRNEPLRKNLLLISTFEVYPVPPSLAFLQIRYQNGSSYIWQTSKISRISCKEKYTHGYYIEPGYCLNYLSIERKKKRNEMTCIWDMGNSMIQSRSSNSYRSTVLTVFSFCPSLSL